MAEETIFREPTDVEKKEMKILGKKSVEDIFRQKNIEYESKYTKANKPYCFRCAKLDFEDKVSSAKREMQRAVDGTEIDMTNIDKLYKSDLNDYADPKNFKLERTQEIWEDKLMDGIRTSVHTGYSLSHKCVKRGCNICVFISKDKYKKPETKLEKTTNPEK